jgi:hypothetical protein
MIRRYGLFLSTLVLLALLVVVSHFFFKTLEQYVHQRDRLTALTSRLRIYTQQQREFEKQVPILGQVNRFIDRAKSMGLERHAWSYYDVNIQETLSLEDTALILNQCANSSTAYFEPIMLYIKKPMPGSQGEPGTASSSSEETSVDQADDIQLTLRGKFAARRE